MAYEIRYIDGITWNVFSDGTAVPVRDDEDTSDNDEATEE